MEVFRSRQVLFDDRGCLAPARIYVQNGKIVRVMDGYEFPKGIPEDEVVCVYDCDRDVIMPGLVDAGTHCNDPGRSEWEGFTTVTKAGVAGGFTTLVDLPIYSVPPTTSVETLFRKINNAKGNSYLDISFLGGMTTSNTGNVKSMVKAGVAGFKCYLSDTGVAGFKSVDILGVENILKEMKNKDSILHVECHYPNRDPEVKGDPSVYQTYLDNNPESAEHDAINAVLDAMHNTGAEVKVHITNLASGSACELVKEAQDDGLPLTADTTYYYLTLTQDNIPDGATEFKACPPIRDEINQELLWDGIKEGVIQNVNTNHLGLPPSIAKNNRGDFLKARAGIDTLQFALPLMWTFGRQQGLSLDECHKLMARGPATACGLEHRKGCLEPGFDADFCIWNPQETFTVTEDMLIHKNKTNPYLGMKLKGVVKQTVVRGVVVYENGQIIVPKPTGLVLLAGELGDEVGRFGDVIPGGPQFKRRTSLTPQMVNTSLLPGEDMQFKQARRNSYYK